MQSAKRVVHHLYSNGSDIDLIPHCGVLPGPDVLTGEWHTGHDRQELLQCLGFGLVTCSTCASPEALGESFAVLVSERDGLLNW